VGLSFTKQKPALLFQTHRVEPQPCLASLSSSNVAFSQFVVAVVPVSVVKDL